MKKVYAFAFAALMAVSGISLSSCSKKDKAAAEGEEAVEATVEEAEEAEEEVEVEAEEAEEEVEVEAEEAEEEVEVEVEEAEDEVEVEAEATCSAAEFIARINACTTAEELILLYGEFEKCQSSFTKEEIKAINKAGEAKGETLNFE